jgi:hypothetical protein
MRIGIMMCLAAAAMTGLSISDGEPGVDESVGAGSGESNDLADASTENASGVADEDVQAVEPVVTESGSDDDADDDDAADEPLVQSA